MGSVLKHRRLSSIAVLACAGSVAVAAESPRQGFNRAWERNMVVVRRTLFALVYNERGRLGNIRRSKRDGLAVVTPFSGTYLQFDGRQSRDDITDHDPQRLLETVTKVYGRDSIEVRDYQRIEPVMLVRYEVGAELLVSDVRIERDTVDTLLGQFVTLKTSR